MAAQADRFFVHGDLVGVDGGLLQNAALVDIRRAEYLLHFFGQPGAVLRKRHGAARLDLFHKRQNGLRAAAKVGLHGRALLFAHGVEFGKRLLDDGQDILRQLLLVLLLLLDHKDVRHTGQGSDGNVVSDAVIGGDGLERGQIPFQNGLIECNLDAHILGDINGDEHIQLAAVHVRLDERLDCILRKAIDARELDVQIQIAVVDCPQLDGDLTSVDDFFRAAIAGHTSNHVVSSIFLRAVRPAHPLRQALRRWNTVRWLRQSRSRRHRP